jgi:hypothetical protein
MPQPSWAAAFLQARNIDTPVVELVTLIAPEWGAPLRYAKYPKDVASRGEVFEKCYFETAIITDDEGPPRSTISIPNIGSRLEKKIAMLRSPPTVTLEVISLAKPDDPLFRAARLMLTGISSDAVFVKADIVGKNYDNEPCGSIRVTPVKFPGILARRY